jgi:hypothetical protein
MPKLALLEGRASMGYNSMRKHTQQQKRSWNAVATASPVLWAPFLEHFMSVAGSRGRRSDEVLHMTVVVCRGYRPPLLSWPAVSFCKSVAWTLNMAKKRRETGEGPSVAVRRGVV